MKKLFLLFIAVITISGCATSFYIQGADKIPRAQRVRLIHDIHTFVLEIDGRPGPMIARGAFAPDTFKLYLTPGTHKIVAASLSYKINKTQPFIEQAEKFVFEKDFVAGETYEIVYRSIDGKVVLAIEKKVTF